MQINILTPEKKVFEGAAKGVILPGTTGYFELLDKHAPIIASLKNGTLRILGTDGKETQLQISGGFIECMDNQVSIMIESLVE